MVNLWGPLRTSSRVVMVLAIMLVALLMVAASAVPAEASSWPTRRQGDRGVDVYSIQRLLTQRGYGLSIDGAFGGETAGQVRYFQARSGLPDDGVVGQGTWSALLIAVRRGSQGQAVIAAQEQLRSNGYNISVDGSFGPQTEGAVRNFQASAGLPTHGVVDGDVWRELTARSPG